MANVVDIQTILSGPRNLVLAIYLKSDGVSGELTNHVIFDPATINRPPSYRMVLEKIVHNFAGFDANVSFNSGGANPNWKWVLSEGTNHPVDFGAFGGLRDDSGQDGNGKLQLTTTGFTSSSDQGSILLHMIKTG